MKFEYLCGAGLGQMGWSILLRFAALATPKPKMSGASQNVDGRV
jgi:hypothetical protein